ncbi:MAG TPA: hypothetical protein PLH07_00215 [Sulfurovum sp.]|jgi:hypothetical protein|nr:MAG: hypothetical protein B7Y63_08050 [Sulfurovum sp. 35-42-20]OYY57464.1 MAG: hypothetical protein B7Y52_00940 [Sulfurovum sp. 28-43-6]OYZ26650.1 MAG: hypothetical protein B7Y23_01300 [Sulfurovum sp. 16-42-52]OYZ48315.1 MAG: hypothetical protein B7Y13_08000 [Sulfurovum sp. 24-42-9]OZA47066.1 MAG: hypothetical protein B7X80_00215 [Sulfurovum sp. 17-42-90]OZA61076.1 MAG: hypothetical protein B7X69_01480 [Sulfurovum sp. 39-42-12]HQR74317.1 hypothetical protein [Sulfurovum sp.]
MRFTILLRLSVLVLIALNGCGGGSSTSTSVADSTALVTVSGIITYDKVHPNSDYVGLDYTHITQEAAKAIQVDAVDTNNQIIATTTTDSAGRYALSVPVNTQLKIRASAKMLKAGTPNWNVAVIDQSNANALYVMEGAFASSGTADSQRTLNAPSGWGGSSYTGTRTAAPFAMLDTIYASMQKVLEADAGAVFPPLLVNWYAGSVEGTYYSDGGLYIFGDEDFDTDEYDDHVIAHEWGHYYEDKFSRTDSIGGAHSEEDTLDIRVAFSEGWGNAFSAMALEHPVYFDTFDAKQANGFNFNVESGTSTTRGWYNESSIQRILYDVYDDVEDGVDSLSFGFAPIHQVLTGAQKTTPAFTSLFTFITALKAENSVSGEAIDALVFDENITTITNIYGTERVKNPYSNLTLGTPLSLQTSTTYGIYNTLDNRKYVRFTIATAGTYTITVTQTNGSDGSNADPDFDIYATASFQRIGFSWSEVVGSEQSSVSLSAGEYLLDVSDFNDVENATFNVTVNLKVN